ncbi:hypothetical protein BH23VER1_BH23VER1_16770 [soil metagenome]
MNCPYCQNPAFETALECQSCGLSLEKVEKLMGAVPAGITAPVADLAQLFSKAERRSVSGAVAKFEERFPQARFSVLATRLPAETHLGIYAFWIFNKGGICRDIDRGPDNRNVLLTIDAGNARANVMVGYGLEPFVGTAHLEQVLTAARPEFAKHRYAEGTLAAIKALSAILAKVSATMDQTYGIQLDAIYRKESGADRPRPVADY